MTDPLTYEPHPTDVVPGPTVALSGVPECISRFSWGRNGNGPTYAVCTVDGEQVTIPWELYAVSGHLLTGDLAMTVVGRRGGYCTVADALLAGES